MVGERGEFLGPAVAGVGAGHHDTWCLYEGGIDRLDRTQVPGEDEDLPAVVRGLGHNLPQTYDLGSARPAVVGCTAHVIEAPLGNRIRVDARLALFKGDEVIVPDHRGQVLQDIFLVTAQIYGATFLRKAI